MGKSKKKSGKGMNRAGRPKIDDRDNKSEFTENRTSPRFETYYKAQNIVPESEWQPLLEAFRASLPVTFRITGSRGTAQDLNDVIKTTYIPHLTNVTWEDNPVPPPTQLPWYPGGLGWQLKVQKAVVRKQPEFKKFQDFLVYETDVGNISRQEAVSMIPPLVLDVESHHIVLDMCAAPGSKTAQLLDALHSNSTTPTSSSSSSSSDEPTGVVIANDSDFRRAYMLVHQSARLHSTALMVTNLDASLFPTLKLNSFTPSGAPQRRVMQFDRILCDVPCSGDGTLRKNPQIWGSWQPAIGNGLHPLQLRILLRAMSLLVPGGRIVYSTCSLNPIENEAVLAAALNATLGEFQLVDISSRLPGLDRRPGMTKWRVATDKELSFFDTYDEYMATLETPKDQKEKGAKVPPTLFPPENAADLHLDRSIRIYPHLQDTGGFFVAVLERTASSPAAVSQSRAESTASLKRTASNLSEIAARVGDAKKPKSTAASIATSDDKAEDADASAAEAAETPVLDVVAPAGNDEAKVATPPRTWKEAPYTFLPPDNKHLVSCLSALHIAPESLSNRMFIRAADIDQPRSIYVCSPLVRDLILANDPSKMRLINCGVKAFMRQANESAKLAKAAAEATTATALDKLTDDAIEVEQTATTEDAVKSDDKDQDKEFVFRFVYEGVQALLPYVDPSSILAASMKELRRMLEVYYPTLTDFAGSPFGEQAQAAARGAHLVRFEPSEYGGATLAKPIIMPLWISAMSLSLMTDKQTKSALCLRLFGEDFTPFGIELQAKKRQTRTLSSAAPGSATADAVDVEADPSAIVVDTDPSDSAVH